MGSFNIQVDATRLVYHDFIIPNITAAWTDASTVQTLSMPAGTYSFQVGSGYYCDFTFEVTSAGLIAYDPKYGTFLAGAGTSTLVLNGFKVTIDARYLPGQGLILSDIPLINNTTDWISLKTMNMLPASYYSVQQGSGIVCNLSFQLDGSGHFQYAANFDVAKGGFLQGAGTSTLVFLGYPLLVDSRGTDGSGVALQPVTWGVPFAYSDVLFVNILPAAGFRLQLVSGLVTGAGFDMDQTGKITLQQQLPEVLSLDTFHGLQRLTVKQSVSVQKPPVGLVPKAPKV